MIYVKSWIKQKQRVIILNYYILIFVLLPIFIIYTDKENEEFYFYSFFSPILYTI